MSQNPTSSSLDNLYGVANVTTPMFTSDRSTAMEVSSTYAQNNFGSIIALMVREAPTPIVIEKHGKPQAVVLPYQEYQEFLAFRQLKERQKVWEKVEALRHEVSQRKGNHSRQLAELATQPLARSKTSQTIAVPSAALADKQKGPQ